MWSAKGEVTAMGLRIQRVTRVKVLSTLIAVFALVAQPLYGVVSSQVARAVSDSELAADSNENTDTVAPNISFQQSIDGQVLSGDVHTRSRIDNETGLVNRVTYIDNVEFKNETNISRNSEIKFNTSNYADGAHTLRVVATDEAGNTSSASQIFTIDNTKPVVKVNLNRLAYVTSGGVASSTQVPEIEAVDENLTRIEVWSDGSKKTEWTNVNKNGLTRKGVSWLGEGLYVIRAYDEAGLVSDDFVLRVDNTAPTGTDNLGLLVSGSVLVTQTVTDNVEAVSGKLRIWKLKSDGTSDDSKFYATSNTNVDANNNVEYSIDTKEKLFGDGVYLAKFTATDKAGNAAIVSEKTFNVDNTKPTINVKADSSIGTGNVFSNVSFKLFDQYKIKSITINSGPEKILTANQYSDANNIAVGKNGGVLGLNTITLKDQAGNSIMYEFYLDNVAPVVSFAYSNNNGNAVTKEDVTVTMTSNEPIAAPAGWTKFDSNTFTKVHTANGKFTVSVNDLALNNAAFGYEVKRIDRILPVINGVVEGRYYSNALTYSVTEQSIDRIIVEMNGVAKTYNQNAAPYTISEDGAYTITVVDKAGNQTSVSFVIDKSKPVINQSEDAASVVEGLKTFDISQTEANPSTLYVEFMRYEWNAAKNEMQWMKKSGKEFKNINAANLTVDTTQWSDDGRYQIKVSSTDMAGNKAGYAFEFSIKNSEPVVFAKPIVTINDTASDRTITGTVSNYPDIDFTKLEIDGNDRLDLTEFIVIDENSVENGVAKWSLTLPEALNADSYGIKLRAKNTQVNSNESEEFVKTVAFTSVQPVGGSGEDDDEETLSSGGASNSNQGSGPLLRVATPITGVLNPVTTPVFGNAAGSIGGVADTDGQSNAVVNPEVLGAQDARENVAQAANPIDASSEGWKVFGVAWYWYAVLAALAAGVWWLLAGLKRRNGDNPTL